MRVHNSRTVSSVLKSKIVYLIYIVLIIFFTAKSIEMLPIWWNARFENKKKEEVLAKKIEQKKRVDENNQDFESDMYRKRYDKEFFNKLENGEKMIILYNKNREIVTDIAQIVEEYELPWWLKKYREIHAWVLNMK